MKIRTASGIVSATCRAPWTSISRTTGRAGLGAALELRAQRPVAPARVAGVLDERALLHQPLELRVVEEVVVDAVLLAGPRLARRRGHDELELRAALAQRPDQRALADARRAGDDEHARHRAAE